VISPEQRNDIDRRIFGPPIDPELELQVAFARADRERAARDRNGNGHAEAKTRAEQNRVLNSDDPGAIARDAEQWPDPMGEASYYGLAGRIVRKIEPHSEADPAALLVQLLVAVGNIVGRDAYADADGAKHRCNLYTVIVGNTSKGRKGTSWGQVVRLMQSVSPAWATERTAEGLSSGEGLIWAVRDKIERLEPIKEKGRVVGSQMVEVDPGISDKRLMAVESEFAGALKVCQREGNTLSAVLRRAWDNGDLRTLTKNSPAVATGAHISIVGHITKEELLRTLAETDAQNGFANRFLWVCARRSKCLPEGGAIAGVDFGVELRELREIFANAEDAGIITRDADSRDLWAFVYPDLSEGKPGLLGAVTSRAEAQVMRLSMIYALLDKSGVVRVPHLRAALAVWDYCLESSKWVFGQRLGDRLADELLSFLRNSPDGLSRTQISNHFGRNQPASRIAMALEMLRRNGSAHSTTTSTGGRSAEIWRYGAATKQTKDTK
jgi:hypothetical protein